MVPVFQLAFRAGHTHATPKPVHTVPAVRAAAPTHTASHTPKSRTLGASCHVTRLRYGLSDDPGTAQAEEDRFMNPFAPHPPLPRRVWYAPRTDPGYDALLHALFHRYTVIKYRADLGPKLSRTLAPRLRAIDPGGVVAVSGGPDLPWPLAGITWGAQVACSAAGEKDLDVLARWANRAAARR